MVSSMGNQSVLKYLKNDDLLSGISSLQPLSSIIEIPSYRSYLSHNKLMETRLATSSLFTAMLSKL